jgi:hypothetical protein
MVWFLISIVLLSFACYAIQVFGNIRFNKLVKREVKNIFKDTVFEDHGVITEKNLRHLPEPVRKYLLKSGVIGKEKVKTVRLNQRAEIRLKPDARWFKHTTAQYFNAESPAYIWYANMPIVLGFSMKVRDKLFMGRGEMLGKLLSVFSIVHANREKIDQGALARFVGEMAWFPSAFLYDYCKWEQIDDYSAKLNVSINGVDVKGIFTFDENYYLKTFQCPRWMDSEDKEMKTYINYFEKFAYRNGIQVPVRGQAVWKLDDGEFVYWEGEITEIEYNFMN